MARLWPQRGEKDRQDTVAFSGRRITGKQKNEELESSCRKEERDEGGRLETRTVVQRMKMDDER